MPHSVLWEQFCKDAEDGRKPRILGEIVLNAAAQGADPKLEERSYGCRYVTANQVLFGISGVFVFPAAELKLAVDEFDSPQPLDFDHDLRAKAIIGRMNEVVYKEDGDNPYIDSKFTLNTITNAEARDAAHNIDTRTLRFVSSEIDAEKAVCSICGHERPFWDTKAACVHVKEFLGRQVGKKLVYETLYGLTIVGCALTRFPADKAAEIAAAAARLGQFSQEGEHMSVENDKTKKPALATGGGGGTGAPAPDEQAAQNAAEGGAVPEEQVAEQQPEGGAPAQETQPPAEQQPAQSTDGEAAGEGGTQPPAEEQPAQNAEGDGEGEGEGEGAAVPDDLGQMTQEQLQAMVKNLSELAQAKDKEIKNLNDTLKAERDAHEAAVRRFEWRISDLQWDLRAIEARAVIKELKDQGHEFSDEEEETYFWKLMRMSDTEFAGVKSTILLSADKHNRRLALQEHNPAKPNGKDGEKPPVQQQAVAPPASGAAPSAKPSQQSAGSGGHPADVPDEFGDDMEKAFDRALKPARPNE